MKKIAVIMLLVLALPLAAAARKDATVMLPGLSMQAKAGRINAMTLSGSKELLTATAREIDGRCSAGTIPAGDCRAAQGYYAVATKEWDSAVKDFQAGKPAYKPHEKAFNSNSDKLVKLLEKYKKGGKPDAKKAH
jgi:hypothetical protein